MDISPIISIFSFNDSISAFDLKKREWYNRWVYFIFTEENKQKQMPIRVRTAYLIKVIALIILGSIWLFEYLNMFPVFLFSLFTYSIYTFKEETNSTGFVFTFISSLQLVKTKKNKSFSSRVIHK